MKMKSEKKKKVVLSVSVDADLFAALDEVVEARGWTRSRFVSDVLEEAVAEEQKTLKQIENPVFQGAARLMAATGGVEVIAAVFDGMTIEQGRKLREQFLEQLDKGKDRRQRKNGVRRSEGLAGA